MAGCCARDRFDPDLGYVGAVESVDPGPIAALSAAGYIPVIAPLGLSADGAVLNINGDDAAADLARGLGATKLLYLSDVPGILDRDGQSALRPHRRADARADRGGCHLAAG